VQLTAPPPDDVCVDDALGLCDQVLGSTDNEALARAVDWFVGRPIQIVLVLFVAWLVQRLLRRGITRGVQRMVLTPAAVARQLERLGRQGDGTPAGDAAAGIDEARRRARAESIGAALATAAAALVWTTAFLMALSIVGIDLAPFIAGAGIIGVAIGFGAQSLVRDCINGIFILIEDQFGIGDAVDLGPATGEVERVTLRTTVLRGVDGTVWHVPNGEIRRVGNRSQLWSMAVIDVPVSYTTDLDRAREFLIEAATSVTASDEWSGDVLDAPRVLGVESLTAEGVVLRLMVKTVPGRQWAVQRALREAIKTTFDRHGVPLPYAPGAPAAPPPPAPAEGA
jgi:small conductance mechanosensitive channel